MSDIISGNIGLYVHRLNSIIPGIINSLNNRSNSEKWMSCIKRNPFRIIGIHSCSGIRVQTKKTARLKMFLDAEQAIHEFNIFPSIGNFQLNEIDLAQAVNQLQFSNERVFYAMLWFYYPVHSTAGFEYIPRTHKKLLEEVDKWENNMLSNVNHEERYAAILNFSTFQLNQSFNGLELNFEMFKNAVYLKLQLIEDAYFDEFQRNVNQGEPAIVKPEDCQILFLEYVIADLKRLGLENYILQLSCFLFELNFICKSKFRENISSRYKLLIEELITESKHYRLNDSLPVKHHWFVTLDIYFEFFELILGKNHLKVSSLGNMIATELLECGASIFAKINNTANENGYEVEKYYKTAKKYVNGVIMQANFDKHYDSFIQWRLTAADRKLKLKHIVDFNFLDTALRDFKHLRNGLNNAKNLIQNCKPNLLRIKRDMGKTDLYMEYCNNVVKSAVNMIVETINEKLDPNLQINHFSEVDNFQLKYLIEQALEIFYMVEYWTKDASFSKSFQSNFSSLKDLAGVLNVSILSPSDKLKSEISNAERQLREVRLANYYSDELKKLKAEYANLQEWQLLRSRKVRDTQLAEQLSKISRKESEAADKKLREQNRINNQIYMFQDKLLEITSIRP